MIRTIEELKSDEPWVLISMASILADMPRRRDEAKRIYESFTKTQKSPYARFRAVQVLLLLGEFDQAREDCRKWVDELSKSGVPRHYHDSARGEWQAVQLIAEPSRLEEFGREKTNRYHRSLKEYILALIALGKGNRSDALRHLEECEKFRNTSPYWARAFKTHLINDPEWPRANKILHPELAVSPR